jgi:NAD(P)-dependent dehydrogenase (short-subunit alcohol dehydrogenase family)
MTEIRRALVVGATGGIGAALLAALRAEPATEAIGLARGTRPAIDLLNEASIAASAAAIGAPLHLIINTIGALHINGAPPEKRLAALTPETLAAAFALNATGPALLLKHFAPLLPRDAPSVFATLSARVGSIADNDLGGWYSYRASKAALNQLMRTAAIELARTHPLAKILCIHPGTVRTGLTKPIIGADNGADPIMAAQQILTVIQNAEASGLFLDQNGKIVPW